MPGTTLFEKVVVSKTPVTAEIFEFKVFTVLVIVFDDKLSEAASVLDFEQLIKAVAKAVTINAFLMFNIYNPLVGLVSLLC